MGIIFNKNIVNYRNGTNIATPVIFLKVLYLCIFLK